MAEPTLDDVFIDDITLPATDGYPLAATLFLPRGAKRHAVLINSGTAVQRKIYRGFAGYLARRIVCRPHPQDQVVRGQRLGLIMFGSRVDHFMPLGCRITVQAGDRVSAGESVIGELS